MGTLVWIVASLFAEQDLVAMVLQAFAIGLRFSTSAACSSAPSTEPKRVIKSFAPLSPMPGAPGMLSTCRL